MPLDFSARNRLIADFRRRVAHANGITPLVHQAEWRLATEGWTLEPRPPTIGEHYEDVLMPAQTLRDVVSAVRTGEMVIGHREIRGIPCVLVRRALTARPGGCAHLCADLAAFKSGKSFYAALWTAGFAVLPDANVDLVGLEYSTCEPEFNYLVEFLCSERGMNMPKAVYHNDSNHGRMKLVLKNGASFVCKSWERKESLKGKKRIAYVYCEAYQLPGLEVYTTLAQNLRELQGFALFPTTPDRPWVGIFHDYGHGHDPDWHCTCCVDAQTNPFTYDQRARDRDDPAKGGIMTRERFAIAWQGKLGRFIGRVYDFQRGNAAWLFTPESHPALWIPREHEGLYEDQAPAHS